MKLSLLCLLAGMVPAEHSGIDFNNTIIENDSIHPISLIHVYNGGMGAWVELYYAGLQQVYQQPPLVGTCLLCS